MLLLYALPAGIAIGLLAGGAPGRLSAIRFRLAPVALFGLGFQLILFSPPVSAALGSAGPVGPALYVGSTALVLGALLANIRLPGVRFIAVGAALNLLVIAANGGFMPASVDAWASLHGIAGLPVATLTNSTFAGPSTLFPFLGDIFVLPRPMPFANVFSIGDALIAVGGAWLIARTMLTDRPLVTRAAASAEQVAARA